MTLTNLVPTTHRTSISLPPANLIYTDNGAETYEKWNPLPATVTESGNVEGHYLFNLIDENHFHVSYPKIRFLSERGVNYSVRASENQ